MITIGDQQLETQRPADLDAVLLASTGCTAAEHARFAARGSAFELARAAMPLLTEKPAGGVGELVAMIDDADLADVRRQIIAALAPEPEAASETAPASVPTPTPVTQPEPAPAPAAPAPTAAPATTA